MENLTSKGDGDDIYKMNEDGTVEIVHEIKPDKLVKYMYQFLALLIKDAIQIFPKSIDLRILSSFVQRNKLHNEFKAIFEIMNCEQLEPTLSERFTIYIRKVDIE